MVAANPPAFCRQNVYTSAMALAAPKDESEVKTRKPLGVRVTPEQHRILTEAARREHRSVSSFVLQAALNAASGTTEKKRRSPEEVRAIIEAAQQEVKAAVPADRSLLRELMEERRREAKVG
jgi:uncharacterized protein (DUF1778 family)